MGYADVITCFHNRFSSNFYFQLKDMSINQIDLRALTWNDIPWLEVEKYVFRFQRRIYTASRKEDREKVHWLQKRLLLTPHAKLLAVRQVVQINAGKQTPGVDRFLPTTPQQRLELARTLQIDGSAEPIRRIFIPKPGTTVRRPLGIPVLRDRAKQALVKLALEPQWEARFEPNSYGFRPGRGCHDAIEAVFNALDGKPKWILDADIAACFESINHQALLEKLDTFPALHRQIESWLKADIMIGYKDRPKSVEYSLAGTPQGGVISPLLANIALHGLETAVDLRFTKTSPKRMKCSCIRYADDFVILHKQETTVREAMTFVNEWLAPMGLTVSETKSKIRASDEGFEFLGCQFIHIQRNGKIRTKISPSKKSQSKLLTLVRDKIQRLKSSATHDLINALNPIIIGWGNYFSRVECKETFTKLDYLIYEKIRAYVLRRHPRWSRATIMEKYFPQNEIFYFRGKVHQDNWILTDRYKDKFGRICRVHLKRLTWIPSVKHIKVQGMQTPYDGDLSYWSLRLRRYLLVNGRDLFLLKQQKGLCTHCGKPFVVGQRIQVDHVIPKALGGKDIYSNLRALHLECQREKTAKDRKEISESKGKKTRGAV